MIHEHTLNYVCTNILFFLNDACRSAPLWIERPLWLSGLFEWPTFWGISVVTAAPRRTWFCACHRHWYPWLRLWFEHRGIFRSIVSAMAHFAFKFPSESWQIRYCTNGCVVQVDTWVGFLSQRWLTAGVPVCLDSMLSVEPLRESWFPLICCFTFV